MESLAPPIEHTWRLEDLFPDEAAFQASRRALDETLLPAVDGFAGRVLESAAVLSDALETIDRAGRSLQRLHCYAALKSDVDTRVARYQAMRQSVALLATELSRRSAYLRPEILAGEPATLERFIDDEPRLAPHAHYLRDLIRQRPHVLGAAEESLVAECGLITRDAGSLYGILADAELPRPEVTLSTGESIRLTPAAFHKARTTPERQDRLRLFPSYFSAYAGFGETLGQNLYTAVKTHLFYSRVRRYDSCLAASLNGDNVPPGVYHNLIRRVREHLPLLHRYFRLRARRLGVERLEYPDLYCSISPAPPRRYDAEQARRSVLEGLAPLGTNYARELERAFGARWIDWHPGPGKRSGAYATGWAYDVHPYVLLNFNGDHESVMTLAHEMGHAMHSHFSNASQPFATADYSIFVAEVASTFNEALVLQRLFDTQPAGEDQLFLLGGYMEALRGTLFRQTMFAEFELAIHDAVERGEVLTGQRLGEIYLDLLREYHGHDEGVVHIDEAYAVEWAAIPHMYYNFYVYQYATGIVAAAALSRAVLGGDAEARDRYLEFLTTGGSDYPLALLRRAGVDLERAGPYLETFRTMEERLDRLEAAG